METKKYTKATCYILRLAIYIALLPVTGLFLYKSNRPTAQRFYYAMCSHQMFRILYGMCFAIGIATINTLNTWITHDITCATLTLAVSLPLLFDKLAHPILRALRGCRQMMFFLMIISLAAMFTQHMLPFAASLYLLIVAVTYYPSKRAMERFQSLTGIHFYHQCPDKLMEEYFE